MEWVFNLHGLVKCLLCFVSGCLMCFRCADQCLFFVGPFNMFESF